MPNVDIIIPKFFKHQNFFKFHFPSYLLNSDWYPVYRNLKTFERMDIKIKFYDFLNYNLKRSSKVVLVDYRIGNDLCAYYKYQEKDRNEIFVNFLKRLREKVESLVLIDTKDSTNIQYELLPYVDKYLKKQLLKDPKLHQKKYFKDRLYTDYYAREYLMKKPLSVDYSKDYNLYKKNKDKISLSWNTAYSLNRFFQKSSRFFHIFSKNYNLVYHKPNKYRSLKLSANFGTNFSSKLMAFQRKQLLKILEKEYKFNHNFSFGSVPSKRYKYNLINSKAVISPFGWGEICYRDFETFILGAALIKPNLDHIRTWPSLFKKYETYLPLSWKIEDWNEQIKEFSSNEKQLLRIANNGQNSYKKLWLREGIISFIEKFNEIITPN